jgi:hypothetical protein
METALKKADGYLWARACEGAGEEIRQASQSADQAAMRHAWAEAERQADLYNLPELADELRRCQDDPSDGRLDLSQHWDGLNRVMRTIVFNRKASQAAQEHGAPELTRYLRAMREAVATETAARLDRVELHDRVPGAGVARHAMAESFGISDATLWQREHGWWQLLQKPGEPEEQAEPQPPPRKAWPPRDRRKRGKRAL